MRQTIEDYIRQNEDFRQGLLKQDGGILTYLAEYLPEQPDTYVDNELLKKYRKQYYDTFLKNNRGNYEVAFLEEDEKKRKAFGYAHLSKEFSYLVALEPVLTLLPTEIAGGARGLISKYMEFAWKENRRLYYPDGTPPDVFYKEVIALYSTGGSARFCMNHLLREHHNPQVWSKIKSDSSRYDEFLFQQYSNVFFQDGGYKKLRLAVKEMTEGKTKEECRQIAVDTMMAVKDFSRMIYSTSETQVLDCTGKYKVDKEWLRKVAYKTILFPINQKVPFLHLCFVNFVLALKKIGMIWAARLLVRGIDMHELEKETGCILFPVSVPTEWPDGLSHDNYNYYVDKEYALDDGYCINNEDKAKELLDKIKHGSNMPEEKVLMWTDRAKLCFQKAVTKGWMNFDNGIYSWCGVKQKPNSKPNKSELAYFLGKVYGYQFKNGNNVGTQLPASELNDYFGFGKKSVTDTLLQLYRRYNEQPYRLIIDDFFNEIVWTKEIKK